MNGPYLLAPSTTGMTVAWEAEDLETAILYYGAKQAMEKIVKVDCERGAPWQDNLQGIYMYRAVLAGLEPNTKYYYRVELSTGKTYSGTFKTLKTKPEKIHLYTISDSHAFAVNQEFAASVLNDTPDFIIHSGDIPLGTGYQKDQFAALWFERGSSFLKDIPVVYIDGNHDDGPYFNDYFMHAQRKAYNASPNGLSFSFNYGNTHFVMVNSIPWGLYEMNAVMSNLPLDEKTANNVKESLKWLEEDLKSAAAIEAKWRIVVMHHPYTDNFTNKHIVHIVEENKVNLMLGGHLHFFQKGVSINPQIGAKILYITQGGGQDPAGEIDYGHPDERILSEYPEIVAMGKTIFSTLDIEEDRLIYRAYGIPDGAATPLVIDETVLALEEPQLTLTNATLEEEGSNGLSFSAVLKNQGRGLAQAVISVLDNGKERLVNLFGRQGQERVVVLKAGQSKEVQGTISFDTPGRHKLTIGEVSRIIDVPEETARYKLSNLTTTVGKDADSLFASVEIDNLHDCTYSTMLDFYINGQVVTSQHVCLAPYEKKLVDFAHRFRQGGKYQIKIGNLEKTVEIEGTLKGTPLVRDLSGKENHGIIRGNPKIKQQADGTVAVCLEEYGDYIEIPDSPSLNVQEGFTGMVWANMHHLAGEGERDHNPLMVKGPSVGWGANYLLRMIVRKIGSIGWGSCFDITEYAWAGGQALVGEWGHYTSGFNKESGGTSYINGAKVAEIAGINNAAKLLSWEGYPIFIGYSFMGHVIKELKRPKYFTHFPGQISQVRFYSSKLNAKENCYVYKHPEECGPRKDEMVAWLNFKDIETKGTHTTEWRRPAQFTPKFKADKKLWKFSVLTAEAIVPKGTLLEAIVEVSDDEETVKGAKQIRLTGNGNNIDISALPEAQYIRIITKFTSALGQVGTFVPELNLYKITAAAGKTTTELSWGTRTDWERGSLEGAIGFEPLRRAKEIAEYTDVIH